MGGDFYDGPPTDFIAVGQVFNELNPKLGKYFVTGNHEEYAGMQEALLGVKAGGFIVTDRVSTMVEGVQIVGIPYVRGEDETEIEDVLEKTDFNKDLPSIVLKHVPLELEVLQKAGASLVLSGHTHQGQIWPFSYITKRMYKGFDYGLNPLGDMQVYTTSGSGTWGPPQRIGTQSEVVILTFKKK
jgi:predicted MPP superfamily phosphohydrolase